MKRKIILATVLCLAVATLGIGAAPALAADGCTCHTDEPPTATAAHAPFVAAVTDCAVCHVDWVVPHPDAGPPSMRLSGSPAAAVSELGGWVGGGGRFFARPHPDVVVYLQQRLRGATAFTDLGQVVTDDKGAYTFSVASPQPYARYRAIAVGHMGATVFFGSRLWMPGVFTTSEPFATTLTLKLVGPTKRTIDLGKSVTAQGTLLPVEATGNKVLVRVQRRYPHGWPHWRTLLERHCTTDAAGDYSTTFTTRRRGSFRIRAIFRGAGDWAPVRTDYRSYWVW